jgi:endonuclease YncB( thermonuclease family)
VAFCPDGQDRYGRTLAVVLADGRDVAEVLIGEGLAREYHGGRREGWCE